MNTSPLLAIAASLSAGLSAFLGAGMAHAERAGFAEKVQQSAFQARSAAGQSVSKGDVIHQQARLYTQQYGSMDIKLDDGTRLTIAPNASIVMDDYVFSAGAASIGLSLGQGAIKMISGRLKAESYTLQTPVATIGIRGTEFWLNATGKELLEIWVLDGAVTAMPLLSETRFTIEAPAYAQCSTTTCEIGSAPPLPISYPLDPRGGSYPDARDRDGEDGVGNQAGP